MKKDIVIFDLDGTLVNTIPAIAASFNYVLNEYGYKTFAVNEYRKFIGGGFLIVFDRVNKILNIKEDKEEFVKKVREHYNKNYLEGIKLYDNIDKVLDALTNKGVDIAIVTNKDHSLAIKHANTILSRWNFKYIYGASETKEYENKPDPNRVNLIAKDYEKDKILFVGDMIVDYDTAKNAGVDLVYCCYGYGADDDKLDCNKVSDALEILNYIER